jgi:glycosyltransferase involved in cell wall biosynthesis
LFNTNKKGRSEMQTINVVTPHYTPEITAAAHRIEALVGSLSTRYKVNVFTLTEIGVKSPANYVQESENVTVRYVNLPRYKKSSLFIRTFFEFWYSITLARLSAQTKHDIAIVTTPFMFLLPAAILFGGKSKKIADVRDLTWRYVPEKFFVHYIIKSIFTRIAKKFLSFYDAITVTNESERQWIVNETPIASEKISIVSNGISREKFEMLSQMKYSRNGNPFTITYVGNIGNGQNLRSIINVVKDLPEVRLVLIGSGNDYPYFRKMVKKKNITNIFFTGKLSWNNVLPYYISSSVLFAKLESNYCSALPSKLFEYLSTGLPVIYCGEGIAPKFLHQFEQVHLTDSNNETALRKIILEMKSSPLTLSNKNRTQILEKYIRENTNRKMFGVINSMMGLETEPVLTPSFHIHPNGLPVLQSLDQNDKQLLAAS